MPRKFNNGSYHSTTTTRSFINGHTHDLNSLKGGKILGVFANGLHQRSNGIIEDEYELVFDERGLRELTPDERINILEEGEELMESAGKTERK